MPPVGDTQKSRPARYVGCLWSSGTAEIINLTMIFCPRMSCFPSFFPESLEFVHYCRFRLVRIYISQSHCYMFSQQSLAKTIADLNLTQWEVRSELLKEHLAPLVGVFGFGKFCIIPY